MKWGINDAQHCTITDVWFLIHCYNTINYKTSHNNVRVILSAANTINHDGKITTADNSGLAFWTDRNHNGLTDVGELEALGAAGAIQVIKLNPYQTLLSGYDANNDGVINGSDAVSNYLYLQTNADDSVTIYLPDNAQARAMIAGYTGGESIQTAQGEKIIKTIQFYSGYEMSLNNELNGTDESETLEGSSICSLTFKPNKKAA